MSKSEFPRTSWLRRFLSRRAGAGRSAADLAAQKISIEETYGPWTAHNCQLTEGLWTIRANGVNFDEKTRRCVRIAQDFFGSNLSGLRVLDLGAGEGASRSSLLLRARTWFAWKGGK